MSARGLLGRRGRRASSSVELATTLPVWFALVTGIADTAWVLHQRSTFAAAVEAGCRAGALRDPGDADLDLPAVREVVRAETLAFLGRFDAAGCPSCDVAVHTEGALPARRLVCEGTREARSITLRWMIDTRLQATRAVRLEWQREVAP